MVAFTLMEMTMQEQVAQLSKSRLMTRADFVGMYRVSYSTLASSIQSGDVALHLHGTSLLVDADEALAALGNPPLRHSAPVVRGDLFA
jgi:hypothetical protein